MSRLRTFAGNHPLIIAGVGAAAVAVVAALYWFQPQALVIDDRVDEGLPGTEAVTGTEDDSTPNSKHSSPEITTLSGSKFRELAHSARGTAQLLKTGDGSLFVRFEDFEVENGPDLRVYLSAAPATASFGFDKDFLDLGALKGNVGSQNYRIPVDTPVERFKSVVVWCRRFSVGFAVAPLDAAS